MQVNQYNKSFFVPAVYCSDHLQGMLDNLIEIKELFELLGYTDQRSVQAWCRKNKIPLIDIGKKTYTLRHFLDNFILNKVEQFLKASYSNSDELMRAINKNDIKLFSEIAKASEIKKSRMQKPVKNSEAAEDFLKKLRQLN